MKPHEIKAGVDQLPVLPADQELEPADVWEQFEGGARFIVARHRLPDPGEPEVVSVTISGNRHDRRRIIKEFTEVFGEPMDKDVDITEGERLDTFVWLNSK